EPRDLGARSRDRREPHRALAPAEHPLVAETSLHPPARLLPELVFRLPPSPAEPRRHGDTEGHGGILELQWRRSCKSHRRNRFTPIQVFLRGPPCLSASVVQGVPSPAAGHKKMGTGAFSSPSPFAFFIAFLPFFRLSSSSSLSIPPLEFSRHRSCGKTGTEGKMHLSPFFLPETRRATEESWNCSGDDRARVTAATASRPFKYSSVALRVSVPPWFKGSQARPQAASTNANLYNSRMNPRLGLLKPYPFERIRSNLAGLVPPTGLPLINLSIGEPQHPTPALLKDAVTKNLGGLARYPQSKGLPELREAMAAWIAKRHGLGTIDPETQVIPVTGSREAIFSIAQAVLDPADKDAYVVCPNPFYQIYEGAALLGGAQPWFVNSIATQGQAADWDS